MGCSSSQLAAAVAPEQAKGAALVDGAAVGKAPDAALKVRTHAALDETPVLCQPASKKKIAFCVQLSVKAGEIGSTDEAKGQEVRSFAPAAFFALLLDAQESPVIGHMISICEDLHLLGSSRVPQWPSG